MAVSPPISYVIPVDCHLYYLTVTHVLLLLLDKQQCKFYKLIHTEGDHRKTFELENEISRDFLR